MSEVSTQYVLFLGQKDQEILFGVCTKRVHTLNPRNVISLSRVIREYFYVIFVRTRTCEDASDRDRGESKQGLLYVAIIDVIYVHTPQLINCPRSIGVDRVRYSPFLFRLHLTDSRRTLSLLKRIPSLFCSTYAICFALSASSHL